MKTAIKIFIGMLVGSALGYAYYYFIGCNGGTCPITSNPYISILYGALFGLILTFPTKRKNGGQGQDKY